MANRLRRMSFSIKAGFKGENKEKEESNIIIDNNSPKSETSPDLKKTKRKSTANMLYRLSGLGFRKSEQVEDPSGGATVPEDFYKILVYLQEHVQEEGIFRIAGNQVKILELKSKLSENNNNIKLSEYDPHVVSGVLKLLLRDMKVPLLPFEVYDWCLAIKELGDDQTLRKNYIKKVLTMCPENNIQILDDLFGFLSNVNNFSNVNKMNSSNLAVVFTPCLIRAKDLNTSVCKMLEDAPIVTSIVETLIENHEVFFSQVYQTTSNLNLQGTIWKSTST